jgi:hypothetical protein
MKKHMIEGFTPLIGSLDKNAQIHNQVRLTRKIVHTTWPYTIFKFLFGIEIRRISI